MNTSFGFPEAQGLYDPSLEKDSCGVGFVAHVKGKPSHQIVWDADQILRNMDHRGACGCESNTGDGAGILTGLPLKFMAKVAKESFRVDLPEAGKFAAGNIFLPTDETEREHCRSVIGELIKKHGQKLIGWRVVPVDADGADIGPTARSGEPVIEQLFVGAADGLNQEQFERQLYLIRKQRAPW